MAGPIGGTRNLPGFKKKPRKTHQNVTTTGRTKNIKKRILSPTFPQYFLGKIILWIFPTQKETLGGDDFKKNSVKKTLSMRSRTPNKVTDHHHWHVHHHSEIKSS